MPRVTSNQDGSMTLTIESGELNALKRAVETHVPEFKRLLDVVNSTQTQELLKFVRSAVR